MVGHQMKPWRGFPFAVGSLIALFAVVGNGEEKPLHDALYWPKNVFGRSISSWTRVLGPTLEISIEDGITEPHTGQPAEFVTLRSPFAAVRFWRNTGDSYAIILDVQSDDFDFIRRFGTQFSIHDRDSLAVLGDPVSTDGNFITYRECGDFLCAFLNVEVNEDSIVGLGWIWEID